MGCGFREGEENLVSAYQKVEGVSFMRKLSHTKTTKINSSTASYQKSILKILPRTFLKEKTAQLQNHQKKSGISSKNIQIIISVIYTKRQKHR